MKATGLDLLTEGDLIERFAEILSEPGEVTCDQMEELRELDAEVERRARLEMN